MDDDKNRLVKSLKVILLHNEIVCILETLKMIINVLKIPFREILILFLLTQRKKDWNRTRSKCRYDKISFQLTTGW